MALIVEFLDRAGTVQTRVRVGDQPITIGRGFENDVILDDAYVDARHARVLGAEDGSVVVEDLGSVNGLIVVGEPASGSTARDATTQRVVVLPGTRVRIGRTTLHFRDTAEPVGPALRDIERGARMEQMLVSDRGRIVVCVGAAALIALSAWLGSYTLDSGSTVLFAGIAVVVLLAMWCGAWAMASRAVVHRSNFVAHYTIASLFAIGAMAVGWSGGWLRFLFPASPLVNPLEVVLGLALGTAILAFHLGFATRMDRFARWRAGAVTVGVIAAVGGLMGYAVGTLFTDVPEYSNILKSFDTDLLPASPVDDFSDVVADLAREADALAEN